jgi:hypothetical protein
MTSPRVTWTLQNVPRTTAVKGDNCVVGPENKVIKISDFGDCSDKELEVTA